jgi:Zn-dependent peptidase ImmA (M78 family)
MSAVERVARSCRAGALGELDPRWVADRLRVRVVVSDLGTSMWGVTLDRDCVAVSSRLSGVERRYAVAHELAHVLGLRAARRQGTGGWREERFADAFARELLLPREDVRAAAADGSVPVAALAGWYGVDEETVLLQAAAVGLASPLQEPPGGTAVLCVQCGHRAHVPGCPCRLARAERQKGASRPDGRR